MDELEQKPVDPLQDGSVGEFLTSLNNYERLYNAENSVEGYSTASKKQKGKLNKEVRKAVGSEIEAMHAEGTISAGPVRGTYQSSYDTGNDFGGEVALQGVYGDEYVAHGHYDEHGVAKKGSVGIKKSSDPHGMRIAHGISEDLGGDPNELAAEWARQSGIV
jgi:hypothetical protein